MAGGVNKTHAVALAGSDADYGKRCSRGTAAVATKTIDKIRVRSRECANVSEGRRMIPVAESNNSALYIRELDNETTSQRIEKQITIVNIVQKSMGIKGVIDNKSASQTIAVLRIYVRMVP